MPNLSVSSLAASIALWRDGSTGFFRFLADVQPRVPSGSGGYVPFEPGPRERAEIIRALDGNGVSVAVFCWPRRHGKTLTSAIIIVWRFLTLPTENIAVIANSEKQVVDTAFRTIRQTFEHPPPHRTVLAGGIGEHPLDQGKVRWELRPWIVAAALDRLGDRRLTEDEQREVWSNAASPEKVAWPEWWSVRE